MGKTRRGGSKYDSDVRSPRTPRPRREDNKTKKRTYTWKQWLIGVSAVALIVAGIYWKWPQATPAQVKAEVKSNAGPEAVDILEKNATKIAEIAQNISPAQAQDASKTIEIAGKGYTGWYSSFFGKPVDTAEEKAIAHLAQLEKEKNDQAARLQEARAREEASLKQAERVAREERGTRARKDAERVLREEAERKTREDAEAQSRLAKQPAELSKFPTLFKVFLNKQILKFSRDWNFAHYPTYTNGVFSTHYLYRNEDGYWVISRNAPVPHAELDIGDQKSVDRFESPVYLQFKKLILMNGQRTWVLDRDTQVY
jgi:hypothetical protein